MANEKRLIDANALITYFEEQYNAAINDPDHVSGYVMAALRCCIDYFKTVPAVDAVEVVRCKDCKHYKEYAHSSVSDYASWGKCKQINMDVDMPVNGYCCYGERKDDVQTGEVS